MPPIFDKGYLIVRGSDAEFDVYGRDGGLAYRIPRANEWSMSNAAVDADGSAAVAMGRSDTAGRIAVYSTSGSRLRTIATGDFIPAYVQFGPDHSIWVAGRGTLRNYSREGERLASYTLLPAEGNWQEPVHQLPGLRVCPDRVGYFMKPEAGRLIWVETDLNGKELGRWPIRRSTPSRPFSLEGRRTCRPTPAFSC